MTAEGSVTRWISALRAGETEAAAKLWDRFFRRMKSLARSQTRPSLTRVAYDEEDVALSAFASFCRALRGGNYPDLKGRTELWQILATFTFRKARERAIASQAAKRGGASLIEDSKRILGGALSAKRAFDEAIPVLQTAVKIAPDNSRAHNNLGGALYAKGRQDDAIAALRKAVELDPDYVGAYVNLSSAHNAKGNMDEAIAALRKASAIDTENGTVQITLGFALFHQGEIDEALPILRKANELVAISKNSAWRVQVLPWLQANLTSWSKQLANDPTPETRTKVTRNLQLLREDASFAAIRLEAADLPDDQRAAWRQFWADVRALQD